MPDKKHIIIYSHGFGVRKDDLGLLTDIAEAFPEIESMLFDYYEVDEIKKTITTCPISAQVERLNKIINETRKSNPEAIIDLIGHSQGTIAAALAKPEGIRKAIFISTVFDVSLKRTLERYKLKSDVEINLEGVSIIPSSTGLTKIIPAQYWQERVAVEPFKEYNAFAEKTDIVVINANHDEILPKVSLEELSPKIKVIQLDGNHSFDGEDRKNLIETIKKEINL
ncbi:MAG: YqiA/YcfP family alpha/beta fold hydrolase [Patescibacteria group bacterium]|jgi:pimeloyl-ACP methyl ester carboxylesterase